MCHLSSSNLGHLQAILHAVETYPDVEQVLKTFRACQCAQPCPQLVVDVICNHGNKWVKVIARKAQAVHLIWAGQGQFGDKSIMDHADHYLHCCTHHPHEYVEPKVVFHFCQGVTPPLQDALVRLGVAVKGTLQAVCGDVTEKLRDACLEECPGGECDNDVCRDSAEKVIVLDLSPQSDGGQATAVAPPGGHTGVRMSTVLPPGDQTTVPSDRSGEVAEVKAEDSVMKVNLDITTVICLISNLCHGRCDYVFQDDVLNLQAKQERTEAVLPSLHKFMQGKELLISETALRDFHSILATVGGDREKERARELLTRVTVVPDSPSPRTQRLKGSGKIKARPKMIFGTGDYHKAVTMTANTSFARAAANQGVNYVVFVHEPRALTEKKEKTAALLHDVDNTT